MNKKAYATPVLTKRQPLQSSAATVVSKPI